MSEQHPLLIDLVLETLLNVVSRASIPICRQVCRKWNGIFLRRFRSEFSVKLNELKSTENFVKLLENCSEIPYSRFHISRLSMNDQWLETVFESCGSQIVFLSLQMTKDDIDICQFRELLIARTPNLEELSIDSHEGLPEEVTNHSKLFPLWCQPVTLGRLKKIFLRFSSGKRFHVEFLKSLFKACPQLEEIIFRKFTNNVSATSDTNKLLTALIESGWKNLSILNLGQLENDCLENLKSLKVNEINLKTFSFEYLTADLESQLLEDFLKTQSESLEQLTLNEYYGTTDLIISFPTMNKLKTLSITAFDKCQIVPLEPISYFVTFPILQSLSVYGWQDKISFNHFFSDTHNMIPLESLTNFQPPYRMNNIQLFQRFQKIFPNVTSLDITSPSNDILAQIWSTWPQLQVLEVFLDWNNVNVDSAFTGISTSHCDQMRQEHCFQKIASMSTTQNSICNLKDLRKFVCEIYEPWRDGDEDSEDLTCLPSDISGYCAFAKMSNMQHIFIARSDMSKKCVESISKQLPLYTHVEIRGPRRQKLISK